MYPVKITATQGTYLCEIVKYGYTYAQVSVKKIIKSFKIWKFTFDLKYTVYKTETACFKGLDSWDRAQMASPEEVCEWYRKVVDDYDSIIEVRRKRIENHKRSWSEFYATQKELDETLKE